MSDNPDFDPFADEAQVEDVWSGGTPINEESGPVMQQKDNWVSFSFVSDSGYDRLQGTVHGEPEYVAEMFGVSENFDGKLSTLMRQAVKIDKWFKKQAAEANPGKA